MKTTPSADQMPVISVITAVYNAEQYLEESILSVINQTYPHVEYILIDGKSKDSTVDIIKKYSSRIKYWISEPDKGIYDAWNKALKEATGDWICFIGADDFFLEPTFFEKVARHLPDLEKQGKTYVYGKINQITPDKAKVIEVLGEDWSRCKPGFSKEMTLAHSGSFHHRSLFQNHGEFNINLKIAGDYEFLLREYCVNNEFAAFLDIPAVGMRTGGMSGNLHNRLKMARETNLARKLNGITQISVPIVLWVLRIRFYMLLKKVFGAKLSNYLADVYRVATGKKKRWSV